LQSEAGSVSESVRFHFVFFKRGRAARTAMAWTSIPYFLIASSL
jgi:hypothetical protein